VDGSVRDRVAEDCGHLLASFLLSDGNHATGDDWAGKRGPEQVYVLRMDDLSDRDGCRCKDTNLVDAVGLDGRVDQFGDEFAPQVLLSYASLSYDVVQGKSDRVTSLKNFAAPDAKAFFSAASKSCARMRM
jgi:hypothetical protein